MIKILFLWALTALSFYNVKGQQVSLQVLYGSDNAMVDQHTSFLFDSACFQR